MKTFNTIYQDYESLANFCKNNNIPNSDKVLLQIFTGVLNEDFINELLNQINKILPNINIIGSSTDGEISDEDINIESTVLSFSVFEKAEIKIYKTTQKDSSSLTSKALIEQFENIDDAKVAIIFADGLHTNGEIFLNTIQKLTQHIEVAGGLSGDNAQFNKTYVFTKDGFDDISAVSAVLYGKDLEVNTAYSFGWEKIGKALKVTKVVENRVYTIDDMTATDVYKKYLGQEIEKKLPATGIEFPLIVDRSGSKVARAVVGKHDDGSLTFAGNIKENENVHFGYGNIENILANRFDLYETISSSPVESIFVYSCMARKRLLGSNVKHEILPLSQIAPVSGFFTYGEFYTTIEDDVYKNRLYNQTMTILTLSENSESYINVTDKKHLDKGQNIQTIQALSHLIKETTNELRDINENLEKMIEDRTVELFSIIENIPSMIFIKDAKDFSFVRLNEAGEKMLGISRNDLIGKDDYDLFSKEQADFFRKMDIELLNNQKAIDIKQEEINTPNGKKILHTRKVLIKSNEDEPIYILGISDDITEIIAQDKIISQQRKMAALGDMLGNIAHQWRQPLSVIATASTGLKLQKEMGILEDKLLFETCDMINENAQYLSNTIDDFKNFIKGDRNKVKFKLLDKIQNVLNLLDGTIKNNSIKVIVDIDEDTNLLGYPNELAQCFINIINNAKDALQSVDKHKRYIFIKGRKLGNCVVIDFRDNAGGIPEDIIENIFIPYFTTKHKSKGTGLGLSMTYSLISDGMDGAIEARNVKFNYENENFTGAEFKITLPQ